MLDITYGGAFLAGLLSFLSPCVLPMVPFYLSYMTGLSVGELRGGERAKGAQWRLFVQATAFALGILSVFVLFGLGATSLGQAFAQWRQELSWVAAAVLTLFGLHFLGVIRIGLLHREARFEAKLKPTTLAGAYVMGMAFSFGWSACVGPALAAILALAAGAGGGLWHGASLLFVYGLGMTGPFVLTAVFAGPFLGWFARHRALMGHVEKLMGVMLIVFAVLIATNSVNLIADWLVRNFDWSATLK